MTTRICLLSFLVSWCAACGTPEPPRSVPTTPTVELGNTEEDTIQWAVLDGFYEEGPIAFPAPLADLRLGMARAEVEPVFDALRGPGPKRPRAGGAVLAAVFKEHPDVGFALVFDGDALQEVDLTLPSAEAMLVLTAAWGAPQNTTVDAEGHSVASWNDAEAGMQVVLTDLGDGRAMARYLAEASLPAAQGQDG